MQRDRRNNLKIQPISIRLAKTLVDKHHSYQKAPQGGLFAMLCTISSEPIGVVIVGRPVSPAMDNGLTAEIARLTMFSQGNQNAASFLLQRCCHAIRALGYQRVISYVRSPALGTCFIAAGFVCDKTSKATPWHSRKPTNELHTQSVNRYTLNIHNPHSFGEKKTFFRK